MINIPVVGRIYHVVDKTTREVVKVGSTIRTLEQRFNHYDYKRKYKNHFLKEVKILVSSELDWYEKGNAYCPFLWHLVASEHLEIMKMKTFKVNSFSNKLSPIYQKFFGLDGSEFGRLGGQSKSINKLEHCRKQGLINKNNGHLQRISVEGGRIQGRRAALSGQIAEARKHVPPEHLLYFGKECGRKAMHNRWHVKRNLVSPNCKLCKAAA